MIDYSTQSKCSNQALKKFRLPLKKHRLHAGIGIYRTQNQNEATKIAKEHAVTHLRNRSYRNKNKE